MTPRQQWTSCVAQLRLLSIYNEVTTIIITADDEEEDMMGNV